MKINEIGLGSRISHPKFGEGIVIGENIGTYKVFFRHEGDKEISKNFEGLELIDFPKEVQNTLALDDVKRILSELLDDRSDLSGVVPLGDRWKGGTIIMQPADKSLQAKEVPMEVFFHKIVMVRDRLRVMEQQINSNDKLNDEEKVNLQQYITRIYGSLTTFNILFKSKDYWFTGDSSN